MSRILAVADEVVTMATPAHFQSVGQWYRDFSQTTDEEVKLLLADAAVRGSSSS